jgi:RNA polymerase sigma factor (sigma-70 family)
MASNDDATIVARALANDPTAFGELYDRWFDHVLDFAYRIVLDTEAAADVAHDTFLAAYRNLGRVPDPQAFGGWLLRITRNRAIDRYRSMRHTAPVDSASSTTPSDPGAAWPEDVIGTFADPARVAEDSGYAALLWDAADALGARDREVLDLTLRHGLTGVEVGDVLGIRPDNATQLVQRAQARLGTALEARVLWRRGAATCAGLRADLIAADADDFDGETVRVVDRHAAGCRECTERKQLNADPAQLFAAIPMLAMPELRTQVAYELADAGVPMRGSHAFDGGEPPAAKPPPRKHRMRRWVVAGAAAAIIVIGALIIGAAALSHEPGPAPVVVVAKSTTTRSSTSSTSTSTSSTSTSTSTTTTTVPVTTAPTTTTTVAPAVAVFKLAPTSITQDYATTTKAGPVLTWNTSGLARVEVYDTAKIFDRVSASGSEVVCPGIAVTKPTGTCAKNPGRYVYALDGFDSSGNLIVHRTVTLTINAAGP